MVVRSLTSAASSATIAHVTIAGNTADSNLNGSGQGGGAALFKLGNPGLSLMNSVVAQNVGGAFPDVYVGSGTPTLAYDLVGVGPVVGSIVDGGGNLAGTAGAPLDPLLGPLADNGGPTLTRALLDGSPAINAGDPGAVPGGAVPAYDQRGFSFARFVAGRLDMGALERGAASADFDRDLDIDGADFLIWQRRPGRRRARGAQQRRGRGCGPRRGRRGSGGVAIAIWSDSLISDIQRRGE